MLVGVRTLVDPNDPADMEKVHALQDALKVEQETARASWKCRNGTRSARRKCVRH